MKALPHGSKKSSRYARVVHLIKSLRVFNFLFCLAHNYKKHRALRQKCFNSMTLRLQKRMICELNLLYLDAVDYYKVGQDKGMLNEQEHEEQKGYEYYVKRQITRCINDYHSQIQKIKWRYGLFANTKTMNADLNNRLQHLFI